MAGLEVEVVEAGGMHMGGRDVEAVAQDMRWRIRKHVGVFAKAPRDKPVPTAQLHSLCYLGPACRQAEASVEDLVGQEESECSLLYSSVHSLLCEHVHPVQDLHGVYIARTG